VAVGFYAYQNQSARPSRARFRALGAIARMESFNPHDLVSSCDRLHLNGVSNANVL
jgi:hypothetical protein